MYDRKVARSLQRQWTAHKDRWNNCTACDLCNTRHKVVLFRGRVPCDILYIGQTFSDTDDMLGSPMEGPTKPILHSIHADVTDTLELELLPYAVTNLLGCRPPEGRDPKHVELEACYPRLLHLIQMAKPNLIVLCGKPAARTIRTLSSLIVHIVDIPHPSYITRMENDNQSVRAELLYRNSVRNIVKAYRSTL